MQEVVSGGGMNVGNPAIPSSSSAPLSKEMELVNLIKRLTGLDYRTKLSMKITEIGLDSVGIVYLQNEIEKKFHVSISFPSLYELDFQKLEQHVLGSKSEVKKEEIDWNKEIEMEEPTKSNAEVKEVKNVFLTGANGFLGIYLLRDLVNRGYFVFCLMRGDGAKKLKESLSFHELEIDLSKVKFINGDLDLKYFGLSGEDFSKIASDVHLVIHNGCNVNGIFPYSLLKATNVESTKQCIKLCEKNNAKLIYISSISSLLLGES